MAEWDAEAGVWVVVDSSYTGLVTEAPTLDALLLRAREALALLREANAEAGAAPPLHLTAIAA